MTEPLLINHGRQDPRVWPLTEKQAALLLDLAAKNFSGRDGRFDYYPAHDETKDAVVGKGLVEAAVNGRFGISIVGYASLAAHLAWHVLVLNGREVAEARAGRIRS